MTKRMGYKDPIYYGAKGSTASTILTNAVDVTYEITPETGSTTSRGDGSTVPINTGETTALSPSLTFTMINDSTDASLTALIAAARTGLAVALRHKTFDCDCVISYNHGAPLKGEETIEFTVEQVSASDRAPVL